MGTTNAGRYALFSGHIKFGCPCGCGRVSVLPIALSKGTGDWEWDGNSALPTLSPSIKQLSGCKWHGWLKAGVWSSASDGPPIAAECSQGVLYEEDLVTKAADVAAAETALKAAQAEPDDTAWLDEPVLDRSKPYGVVVGDPVKRFQQNELFFDHFGKLIKE